MGKEIVVFDIWGDFAHFRRGYTTTSSLTYPFPPKTTVSGMVAALLGIPNEKSEKNYYRILTPENFKVGIRILNPIKTTVIKENLINTKISENPLYFKYGLISSQKGRSQIPIQFLKNPKFRIYLWFNEKLDEEKRELVKLLEEHKCFYTPYLGITECISNFNYVGVFNYSEVRPNLNGLCEIDSIVPENAGEVVVEEGKTYGSVRVPVFINEKRVGEAYEEVIYLEEGNPIEKRNTVKLKVSNSHNKYIFAKIGEENVILF